MLKDFKNIWSGGFKIGFILGLVITLFIHKYYFLSGDNFLIFQAVFTVLFGFLLQPLRPFFDKFKRQKTSKIDNKINSAVQKNQSKSEIKITEEAKNTISFGYESSGGETSYRMVDVLSVDEVYIEGYCHYREDFRTFRLDRIISGITVDGVVYSVDDWLKTKNIFRHKFTVCFLGFKDIAKLSAIAEENHFDVRTNISKNLNFLVLGKNADKTKVEKALGYGVVCMSENEFIQMIETGEIPE